MLLLLLLLLPLLLATITSKLPTLADGDYIEEERDRAGSAERQERERRPAGRRPAARGGLAGLL